MIFPARSFTGLRSSLLRSRKLMLATCGLLALGWCGCESRRTSPTDGTSTAESSATESDAQASMAGDLITSIVETFRFENLGVSSDLNHGVSLLNQWQRLGLGIQDEQFTLKPETRDTLEKYLTADELTNLRRTLYTRRDGEHLRNNLLYRAIQEHAIGRANSELERVVNVFDHLMHNIDLMQSHPDGTPLLPYQAYLLGRGTVEDRAWLFASVLRQLRIDSVLLFPQEGSKESANYPFLVGVLLGENVYLFDPKLGLPILAPADSSKDRPQVATLKQVQDDPGLLKRFDASADEPYPIRAESLKNPQVALVGDTSLWSPRMEQLQPAFVGNNAAEIYDGLTSTEKHRGLLDRLASYAGKAWKAEDLRVWSYPEKQLQGAENLNAIQLQRLQALTDTWRAPFIVVQNQQRQLALEPSFTLLRARMAQAEGKFDDAVRLFMTVQVKSHIPAEAQVDPVLRQNHERAADDATYFTGVAKFEQGGEQELRVAADKFQQYLKSRPTGVWANSSRYLLALIQAQVGQPAAAAETLGQVSELHPQHLGYAYLIRQWREAAGETGAGRTDAGKPDADKAKPATAETDKPKMEKKAAADKPEPAKPAPAKPEEAKPNNADKPRTEKPDADMPKTDKPAGDAATGDQPAEKKADDAPATPPAEDSTPSEG